MALLAAAQGKSSSRTEPFQTTLTFIAILACYGYRDVWPLLTFTLHPKDGSEGWILWAKVALATIVGIIVPLLEPYPYISSDKTVRSLEEFLETDAMLIRSYSRKLQGSPIQNRRLRFFHSFCSLTWTPR